MLTHSALLSSNSSVLVSDHLLYLDSRLVFRIYDAPTRQRWDGEVSIAPAEFADSLTIRAEEVSVDRGISLVM